MGDRKFLKKTPSIVRQLSLRVMFFVIHCPMKLVSSCSRWRLLILMFWGWATLNGHWYWILGLKKADNKTKRFAISTPGVFTVKWDGHSYPLQERERYWLEWLEICQEILPPWMTTTHMAHINISMHSPDDILHQLRCTLSNILYIYIYMDDMYILCYADDHFEQVHTDDILMLTTIAFQGPTGWTHHKRKVTWGPARASRLQILHFFRVQWFCDRPSVICFLYVNGIHWPLMDYAARSLTEGSHLFLRIRSEREDWCEVVHSEALERNRRVFQSSDEEPEDQQEEAEEESPEHQEDDEVDSDGLAEGHRSRSRSRDDSDYSDDSSLMQLMLWKQPMTGVVGPELVLREGKPHVDDLWCAQPCVDKFGTASFHWAEPYIVQVRREGCNDRVKWRVSDIILNEFALVFYAAVGCLVALVRADICKCRRRRLCMVGRVRHQTRARSRCQSRLVVCFILYVLMSQHCLAPVRGRQLRYGENNRHIEDPEWFSAFDRLPPPGNGPACVLELSSLLPEETRSEVGIENCATNEVDNDYSVEVPERLVETLMALLHGQLRTMETSDIDVQRLHQTTQDAWETWSVNNISSNPIQAVHVYTDGSAGMYHGEHAYARKAAWAFGIWLESDGGRSLLATDCGHVCTR